MARIGIDARYMENENTGIGRYSFNLLANLLEQDSRNTYWVAIRKEYEGELLDAPNVNYVRFSYNPISLATLVSLSRTVRKMDLDLWHAHFPVAPLFSGIPFLVTVHDLQPIRVPSMGGGRSLPLRIAYRMYYPPVYWASINLSTAIVSVSLATCKEVQDVFSVPREKIRVIPEALDGRFLEDQGNPPLEKDTPWETLPKRFLLYVGSTLPHKNLESMIKGFARALEILPGTEDLFLVIAGRPSRFDEQWNRLSRELGISNRIHRISYVSQRDLPSLYSRAAALLHVCCYEGFGFPPLEAMKHGLPVVAASHTSLPEVVGSAGIFVNPKDTEGIARAIGKVLRDEPLRQRLSNYGRINLERYGWQRAARETLHLYEQILERTCLRPS